ncbi:MAG: aspartate/glutamate racemase family protein [Deltaproteobacteria bacterium]|nr:aspartate/glutamate racemase family protein [Deltaproteobacteria bacterium]
MKGIIGGGRSIYGQALGIIVTDSRFPRIPGDIGNATTWDFPVAYRVVRGIHPRRIVRGEAPKDLDAFIEAAIELEKEGVRAITTSCGFLALFQKELSACVGVPLFTSSLMQVPLVHRLLRSDQKVGIITIDAAALTERHLAAVGADGTPAAIVGTEGGRSFTSTFVDNEGELNTEEAEADLVSAARTLTAGHPEVGAIVLECTNMPPYARAVQDATGLPVFDIFTLTNFVYHAVVRKDFKGFM